MSALKTLARKGLHTVGGIHLVRGLKSGIRILTYHRFSANNVDILETQCRYLRRHYEPVSLSEVAYSLSKRKSLARNAIAVTVDDGYRDFFERAAPILRAFKIPATVFLVGAFIDREQWLWWDRLIYAIKRTHCTMLECDLGVIPIGNDAERAIGLDSLIEGLKRLPNKMRLANLESILQQLDVPFPLEIPEEMSPLGWDEIRTLRGQHTEFGGHTRTHPILSRIETPEEVFEEVSSCKLRIEQELGEPVRHFAYPNGRFGDVNDVVIEAVERAGYELAVTTINGINSGDDPPYFLKRITAEADMEHEYFAELVAGLHGGVNRGPQE